jgi:hypothetical protein
MTDLVIPLGALGIVAFVLFCSQWDWKWMMFKPNPRRHIPTEEEQMKAREQDMS